MSSLVKSEDAFLGRLFGSEWANRLVMSLPFGEKTQPMQAPSPPPLPPQQLPKDNDDDEDDDYEEEEQEDENNDEGGVEEEDEEKGQDAEELLDQQQRQQPQPPNRLHHQLFEDASHFQAVAKERKELNLQKIAKRPREESPPMEQKEIKMETEAITVVDEEDHEGHPDHLDNTNDDDKDHGDEVLQSTATTKTATTTTTAVATTTKTENMGLVSSSATILERRLRLQERSQTLLEAISVSIPKEIGGIPKTKDDEDVRAGVVRLFTRHATAVLHQQGVVVLRKDGYIFPRKLLTLLRQAATILQNCIIERLDETGKIWSALQVPELQVPEEDGTMFGEQDYSFTYKEVASRCLGRLDIRYGMDQLPFSSPQVIHNPWLMPLIHCILGESAKLVYAGLILSFPGSAKQPWHQDGHPLFPELLDAEETMADLPTYALNVFIPLTPIESSLGPTEFWVASHKETHLERVQNILASSDNHDDFFPSLTNDDDPLGVVAPTLNKGDILIYDYRICHRGTENVSTKAVRPMLYLMYARPWFAEHVNFGSKELMGSRPPPLLPTEWRPQPKPAEGAESFKKIKRER